MLTNRGVQIISTIVLIRYVKFFSASDLLNGQTNISRHSFLLLALFLLTCDFTLRTCNENPLLICKNLFLYRIMKANSKNTCL